MAQFMIGTKRDRGLAGWLASPVLDRHERYALAVLATMLAGSIQFAFGALDPTNLPFAPYCLAILLVAVLYGRCPGLLCAGLSIIADYINNQVTGTRASSIAAWLAPAAIELLVGAGIAWVGGTLGAVRRQMLQGVVLQAAPAATATPAPPDIHAPTAATIQVDADGVVRSFDGDAERLLGWQAASVLGRPFSRLQAEATTSSGGPEINRFLPPLGSGRTARWYSALLSRADGQTFTVDLTIAEAAGSEQRFNLAIRDRQTRNATEDHLTELQTRISQVARIGAVGEMGSTIAHQLNQPLAAITNYVKAAQRLLATAAGPKNAEVTLALDKAAEQSLRAGHVLRQARELVTLSERSRQTERISDVLEEAIAVVLMWPRDGGAAITLELERPDELILVDRILIQQVVVSLIRNAQREMLDADRKELRIVTRRRGDATLEVLIADSGPGMDQVVLSQIFDPFVSGRSDRIGMGLSVSRSIVEAHGGTIAAATNPTGGTILSFTLPLQIERRAAAD